MNSQLMLTIAQSHQYDLQRAAERWNSAAKTDCRSRRFARRLRINGIVVRRRAAGSVVTRPVTSH
ncbi:MAG: hypothetical protein ACJ764_12250 [Solirubrobacteraceae bacterium]